MIDIEQNIRTGFSDYQESNLDNFEYSAENPIYVTDKKESKATIEHNINALLKKKACVIKNDSSNSVCVLSIDKGLLSGSHCDFATFDNKTKFVFVEMKMNASSTNEITNGENIQKAQAQIMNTFNFFKERKIDLVKNCKIELLLCMPDIYPRTNFTRFAKTLKYLDDNKIKMYIENKIDFK